ncbi:hypothetical protein FRC08_004946 [Ceratobasidium sp. 394]|nr:hypothetical protein FRC08_004946 [Ceratobasidium sp. 394]
MAKGKNLNPADAHRKAQRAKELKKNKENRAKARETATLKKDTSGLETEIQDLEELGEAKLDQKQTARLKELRAEVERIRKIKQDYVQAHPEQAHLVRGLHGSRRRQEPSASGGSAPPAVRSIFGKNGLPIHPERSLYYDPVMNPYGMPPPGMPYAERPLLPHEIEEEQRQSQLTSADTGADVDAEMSDGSEESDSDEAESDEDIAMPAGPPPDGVKDDDDGSSSEDSDDDIPMPPGPPPPKSAPPLPQGPPPPVFPFPTGAPYPGPLPPFPPTFSPYPNAPNIPPPPPGLPMGFQPGYAPPIGQVAMPYPPQISGPVRGPKPPRDRQHAEAARVVQDPLSDIPHVTFQAHQAQRYQLPPAPSQPSAGLPAKPSGTLQATTSATVSAEPELRDLKKEATAFVPASMRRAAKKGPSNNATTGLQIDAAPGEKDDSSPPAEARKDLVSTLGSQLGVGNKSTASSNSGQAGQSKDDYDKFLAEVGSFL